MSTYIAYMNIVILMFYVKNTHHIEDVKIQPEGLDLLIENNATPSPHSAASRQNGGERKGWRLCILLKDQPLFRNGNF